MRLAGFNTRGVNTEPMNGQGIYPAVQTVAASWHDTTIVSPATLSVTFDERGIAGQSLAVAYDLRTRVGEELPASWDDCIAVQNAVDVLWHITGGVLGQSLIRWNVPFSPRQASSLAKAIGSSSLTRHTHITPIGH